MNRRDLLLLTASSVVPVWPHAAHAILPAPPPSPNYLIFIANGVYRITALRIIHVPASVGNAQTYTRSGLSAAVTSTFTFTGRNGISAFYMLVGAPSYRWWEVVDRRNSMIYKLWEGGKFEIKFADGSRVKAIFNRPGALYTFDALVGTERLPDGTRLYPRERLDGGDGKARGAKDSDVIMVKPTVFTFSWSWSSQETPW